MIAAAAVFTFWAAFFGFLSLKEIAWREPDPLDLRFRKAFPRPSPPTGPDSKLPEDRLLRAGLKRGSDKETFLFGQRVALILSFTVTGTLFFCQLPWRHVTFWSIVTTVFFLALPRLWILRKTFKRRKEIRRHLPDTLDLLVLCLEAGLSFDSALVRVAEEMRGVSTQISRELTYTNHEVLAGKPREQALKNLAWRVAVPDLDNLLAAVLQSIKLGTSLGKTLRVQAEVLRKKRRERIRAQILKTPVKLIFPLMLCIFPTLILVILGPSLINIFRHLTDTGIS